MLKRLIMGVAVVGTGLVTQAGELEDNVGIGLGTEIFRGQTGLVQQVLAATTNGILGNQTFAISSGTLGARKPDSLVRRETLQKFLANNMDQVASDIAVGQGEALDTVVELMNVPKQDQANFRRRLQANFGSIYGDGTVTHLDVLNSLDALARG